MISLLPEIAVPFDTACFTSILIEAMPIVGPEPHSEMGHSMSSLSRNADQDRKYSGRHSYLRKQSSPLIHADATARAWFLNEPLLIQAHH